MKYTSDMQRFYDDFVLELLQKGFTQNQAHDIIQNAFYTTVEIINNVYARNG